MTAPHPPETPKAPEGPEDPPEIRALIWYTGHLLLAPLRQVSGKPVTLPTQRMAQQAARRVLARTASNARASQIAQLVAAHVVFLGHGREARLICPIAELVRALARGACYTAADYARAGDAAGSFAMGAIAGMAGPAAAAGLGPGEAAEAVAAVVGSAATP